MRDETSRSSQSELTGSEEEPLAAVLQYEALRPNRPIYAAEDYEHGARFSNIMRNTGLFFRILRGSVRPTKTDYNDRLSKYSGACVS